MTPNEKRAKEVKIAIADLLRKAAPNREDKEKLADYIGHSFSAVESMIYRQQGGTDAWINAILFLFDLNSKDVTSGISDFNSILKKRNPLKESDKIWFKEIDALFNEEEKIYWLKMMKYAAKLKSLGSVKK